MVNPSLSVRQALADGDCLADKKELFGPLKLMYDSLVATGARRGGRERAFGLLPDCCLWTACAAPLARGALSCNPLAATPATTTTTTNLTPPSNLQHQSHATTNTTTPQPITIQATSRPPTRACSTCCARSSASASRSCASTSARSRRATPTSWTRSRRTSRWARTPSGRRSGGSSEAARCMGGRMHAEAHAHGGAAGAWAEGACAWGARMRMEVQCTSTTLPAALEPNTPPTPPTQNAKHQPPNQIKNKVPARRAARPPPALPARHGHDRRRARGRGHLPVSRGERVKAFVSFLLEGAGRREG